MKELAELIGIQIKNLSEQGKQYVRISFTDFVAVAIAALFEPPYMHLAAYLAEVSKGTVPLWGTAHCVSAQHAATALGTLGHTLDYDDISPIMIGHPTVVLTPVLLALGYEQKKSGKELLEAYVLGYEAIGRISAGAADAQYNQAWHTTSTIGIMGAIVSAAKLLSLTGEQTLHALGIASSMASGLRANFGSMTKPLHPGMAAGNAIFACKLAQRGFEASADALDSNQSYFSVYGGKYNYPVRSRMYIEDGIIVKPYPSCGYSTKVIDCAIAIRKQQELHLEEIDSIVCFVSPLTAKVLRYESPTTGMEAKFSLEYCIVQALLHGPLQMFHFTDDYVRGQQDTRQVMNKIQRRIPQDLMEEVAFSKEYVELHIHLKTGKILTARICESKGYPGNPLTEEEFRGKFADCTKTMLNTDQQNILYDKLLQFDSIEDVSQIFEEIHILITMDTISKNT